MRAIVTLSVRAVALGAVMCLSAGCGGDTDGTFEYIGTAGTPVAADFSQLVPVVQISVGGGPALPFIVDTGSPITSLDASAFGDVTGRRHDELAGFGLTFPSYPDVQFDLFGSGAGDQQPAVGLIGGDLLRHFAFTLDYKGERVWLSDPYDPTKLPGDIATGAAVQAPFELLGGGDAEIAACPECGSFILPATRITLQMRFEGQTAPVWVVLDTGASDTTISVDLLAALGATPARPHLDVETETPTGSDPAYLTRVWRAAVVDESGTDIATVDDLPVEIQPGSDLFTSLSGEVGRPVQALLGGDFLRYHFTTIDYQRGLLELARYLDESHISPDEFSSLGFLLGPIGASWTVTEVYDGTDAAAQGVVVGDVVDALDGTTITGLSAAVVEGLFDGYHLGDHVAVTLHHAGAGDATLDLQVVNLLPDYPPPT